ncbi:hypothetical protein D3C80_1625050 [compost metagenome]
MQHFGCDTTRNSRFGFLLLTKNAVIGDDVTHFMRDDGCDFGRVVSQRQQAARYVEKTARQSEGIDVGAVEDCDAIGLIRLVGNRCQIANDLGDHAFKLRIFILAAIGGEDARMLLRADLCQPVVTRDVFNGDRI